MARDSGRHTVTLKAADAASRDLVPVPYDVLADPSSDTLIGAALTLWPQGAAWGTPDGAAMSLGSKLARFTRVLLDPFLWLYRRAYLLAREATLSGVAELLPEWEADYGLPDICDDTEATTGERLKRLAAKVMSARVVTPPEFIRLAREYGFEVAIEEPCVFGCGGSECGGEHETGGYEEEVYFIVRIRDLQVNYFVAGESEIGFDPLFAYGATAKLICIIRQMAPAWTIPVLGPWRYFGDFDEEPGPLIFGGNGIQLS
jgi:uncharacterized protein YmfQ (DUF2313 family)